MESVAARICREAGGRVTTNILVRDLDLDLEDPGDARRLEVVVDGLPLHGGSQLAVDTTMVSALRGDGSARAGADRDCGQTTKGTTISRIGWAARARLVVLAVEGGRWSLRRRISCRSWQKPKPETRIGSSDEERKWWRAQLRGRWLRHSSNFPKHQEQMGRHLRSTIERDLAGFVG